VKYLLVLMIVPLFAASAYAQSTLQTLPTSDGTLNVSIWMDARPEPKVENRLNIDFINPSTERTQEHIDYTVEITRDGETVFGPIPLIHTSTGIVGIPIEFRNEGIHEMIIGVEGILFQPIARETVAFDFPVGAAAAQPAVPEDESGCLIATAAYGTEMADQVQLLREIRDNTLLKTESGSSFMSVFNSIYYSFSPAVADLERENQAFRELTKIAITPMISSISILENAQIDSEAEIVLYGASIIILNIGIYVGIPGAVLWRIARHKRNRAPQTIVTDRG